MSNRRTGSEKMKHLEHCIFCNKVIPIEELGLKDKHIGTLCKSCFNWLNKEFLPILRRVNA